MQWTDPLSLNRRKSKHGPRSPVAPPSPDWRANCQVHRFCLDSLTFGGTSPTVSLSIRYRTLTRHYYYHIVEGLDTMGFPTSKRDCAYLLFFATHLPIIFLVDTVPLQPTWLQTDLSASLRSYYVATYRDKFFEAPTPVWFQAFIWMELVYHVPLSLWAVWGLLRGESIHPSPRQTTATHWAPGSSCLLERSTEAIMLINRPPPRPSPPPRLRRPGFRHLPNLSGGGLELD